MMTARYRYEPYGEIRFIDNANSDTPWRFAGAWFDRFPSSNPATQLGLYKIGERFYDARIGRWTQRGPLNQASDLRQSNRYLYAAGDPVNITDPTGLFGLDEIASIGVEAVGAGCATAGLFGGGTGIGVCAADNRTVGRPGGRSRPVQGGERPRGRRARSGRGRRGRRSSCRQGGGAGLFEGHVDAWSNARRRWRSLR
jgi:RHS repeat-associated protein